MSAEVVGQLATPVDELPAIDFDRLSDADIAEVLHDLEAARRRLATVDHASANQAATRSLAGVPNVTAMPDVRLPSLI